MTAQAPTSSERADACLADLDDAGRAVARRVFLRLVSFDDGRADPRDPQPVSALQAHDAPGRLADTLRRLADARLVRIDGELDREDARVGIEDETMIAAWPALQAWLRSHGRTEQLRRRLEADAAAWRARVDAAPGTDPGPGDAGLLDRDQLGELDGWLAADAGRDLGVSDVAASFIAASRAAARRGWWPGRGSAGTALAILLILLILATPITLLSIVGFTAAVIHALGV